MDLPEGFHQEVIEARENNPKNVSSSQNLVSTEPLKKGGASFKTNVLVEISSTKLVYKPSVRVALFCFIFLAVGLGVLFFGLYPFEGDSNEVKWLVVLFGLIFSTVGGLMFYYFYKPRAFDKQLGLYYSTYNFSLHPTEKVKAQDYIYLKNIVALQILGEYVRGSDRPYKSFELNIVLNDNTRRNVIDHGNLKSIIKDAQRISDFLNVPIWHAGSTKN